MDSGEKIRLSLADQLQPLRSRFKIGSPVVRHVVSTTADLAGSDKLTAISSARQCVLKWLSARVGDLPQEAWDGRSFEHMSPGRFAAGVRIDIPDGEYWAVRCDDPDKTIPGRTWTTEVSIARQNNSASFGLKLMVATNEPVPNYVPSIPGVVRQLADSPGLIRNGRRLTVEPFIVNSDEGLQYFIDLLVDRRRRTPVFAISLEEDQSDPLTAAVDPYKLAKRCLGIAHVVVVSGPQAFRLSSAVGKKLSVFRRAVRTYRPEMMLDDDPHRHPLALAVQIGEWQQQGPSAFSDTLVWDAARNSSITVDELRDLPSFTKVKQISLHQMREHAENERDYPALLALADEELKEKQMEIEVLESIVSEEEEKRQFAENRAAELESANSYLRGRVIYFEKTPRSEISNADKNIPNNYDELPEWIDREFSAIMHLS